MYRYVALIWDTANASAAASSNEICKQLERWNRTVDQSGLIVFDSGSMDSSATRVLEDGAGALCGRVFPDVTASGALVRSGGQLLIEQHWGRYTAFLRDATSGEVHVIRDPTAGLPCFATMLDGGVHIVFSSIESVMPLSGLRLSVNWKYVTAFTAYSALQIRDTALEQVTEVQAGERLTFCRGEIRRQLLWNPLMVVERGLIDDPFEATVALHECVRSCVHTWAGQYSSILHDLSGGLDSSMVLSCLVDAPTRPDIACLHFYAPESREDERQYARLMASHCKVELIERPLEPNALDLRQLLNIRLSPRPWFYIYDLEQTPIEIEVAAARDARAIFSGSGGDGLFLQARAELAVADYLRRHGFRPGIMRVALNAARITRTSLWPLLRDGVRLHLKRPTRHNFGGVDSVRTLVPADVFAAARNDDSLIHPWLAGIGGIPPGLRWHILTLSMAPAFYGAFADPREVERTPPLLSQPLVELCLRIPSYVWISGGRDRSLVRRAFAADLPPAIIRRVRKGSIDRHNRKLIDANESFLREMLLDGLLVRHGLLDRARLESFLSRGATPRGYEYNEITRHHLGTEVWLRRWQSATTAYAG